MSQWAALKRSSVEGLVAVALAVVEKDDDDESNQNRKVRVEGKLER